MAGEHVLIIDDDPDIREALEIVLGAAGYRVTGCATGPAGLEAARTDRPDIVLLDIMLASPVEGFYLARDLKEDEATASIPIIMISAIGRTLGADYVQEMGGVRVSAEAFLDKPLKIETVLRVVRETLDKKGA